MGVRDRAMLYGYVKLDRYSLEQAFSLQKCPAKLLDDRHRTTLFHEINQLRWSDPRIALPIETAGVREKACLAPVAGINCLVVDC